MQDAHNPSSIMDKVPAKILSAAKQSTAPQKVPKWNQLIAKICFSPSLFEASPNPPRASFSRHRQSTRYLMAHITTASVHRRKRIKAPKPPYLQPATSQEENLLYRQQNYSPHVTSHALTKTKLKSTALVTPCVGEKSANMTKSELSAHHRPLHMLK